MSSLSHDYACFLCHNSKDKPIVRVIYQALQQEYDLPTYIDESKLVSGEEWEKSIHAAMARSKTCAILIGGNGWGGYQLEGEAKPALARRARDPTFRVIPVLLPGANPQALLDLREFFDRTHWVDFRSAGERAAIRTLASAIRGENPFPEGRPELTPMRISFDSIRWDVSGRRDVSVLYGGKQLREALALRAERSSDFTNIATEFLFAGERRQNEVLGRGLAAHAAALINSPSQRELAANLALEAVGRFPSPEAHAVLRSTRTKLPRVTAQFGHPAPVTAAAMDHAGMATGCRDGSVAFWDGKALALARWKHGAEVRAVVFDPDSAWLATGSDDGSIAIWDIERFEPRLMLTLGDAVTKLEVRSGREGNLLLASSGRPGHSGKVSLWNTAQWKQIWSGGMIMDATFDASGAHLVLAWGDHVAIRDASSGELLGKCPLDGTVIAIATHPTRPLIAATSFTRQIWIGHIEREKSEMRPLGDSISPASQVRFSPDGRWLAAAGDDSHIRVWDVNTEQLHRYPYQGLLGVDFGFSPHDTFLSVISQERKSIALWHLLSDQMLCVLEYDNPSVALFSDDERMVLAASAGTSAHMLELPRQDEALWSMALGYTWTLTFSPDGQWLAWIGRTIEPNLRIGPPALVVLRVDTAAPALLVKLPDAPEVNATEVVFDREGKEVAAFLDGAVRVWNVESGAEHTGVEPPEWASRPARRAVSDLLQARPIAEACEQRGHVSAVASLDERWLAIDHGGQLLSVWNTTSATELFSSSMRAEVSAMAFSPAGELFTAGDAHGGISVWRTSGMALAQFEHNEPILKLSFSPDATLLAAASADGGVRMWIVAPEILAAQVRPRLSRGLSREEWLRYMGDEPYPDVEAAAAGQA